MGGTCAARRSIGGRAATYVKRRPGGHAERQGAAVGGGGHQMGRQPAPGAWPCAVASAARRSEASQEWLQAAAPRGIAASLAAAARPGLEGPPPAPSTFATWPQYLFPSLTSQIAIPYSKCVPTGEGTNKRRVAFKKGLVCRGACVCVACMGESLADMTCVGKSGSAFDNLSNLNSVNRVKEASGNKFGKNALFYTGGGRGRRGRPRERPPAHRQSHRPAEAPRGAAAVPVSSALQEVASIRKRRRRLWRAAVSA